MLCLITIAFQRHIGFANRVGLRIDFLTKQMNGYILASPLCESLKSVLSNRKHATRPAGSVITRVRGIFNPVSNRHKHEVSHQLNNVTRCPVFTSLFIVGLIEFAHQLLENRAHAMIIQTGMLQYGFLCILVHGIRAKIDVRRDEFFDNRN